MKRREERKSDARTTSFLHQRHELPWDEEDDKMISMTTKKGGTYTVLKEAVCVAQTWWHAHMLTNE